MQTSIRAVIFDMDGTLVDTELAAAQTVQEVFATWGLILTEKDTRYVVGRTWESAFAYLFEHQSIPVPKDVAKRMILEKYEQGISKNLKVIPGSVEAVKTLKHDFPLGLVSGSGRSQISTILKKLGIEEEFQVILGAEDYSQGKPSPEGFLKASHQLRVPPSSCLVFEDSNAGISAAKAAGMTVVAVTLANHFNQDLSKADLKIRDFQNISRQWIQNLSID